MITLVMPVYNEEKYVFDSISSIRNQSVEKFELIIVNDGSTDNTVDLIYKAIENDDRIKFINPNHKIGKNGAINLGYENMSGEWLYFMGADDKLPENALELWENAVQGLNPLEPVAIRGRMLVESESNKYDGLVLPKNKNKENFSGPLTLQSKGMLKYCFPLPLNYPNEDSWWGLCIKYFAKKIYIDDIIVKYNIHEGNSISRNSTFNEFNNKYHIRYIVREDFLKKFDSELSESDKIELKRELENEELRYTGKTRHLVFKKNISFMNKIRLIMFSNKNLYTIKKKFDRVLLGH